MTTPSRPAAASASWILVAVAWALVGIPLAWGIYRTLKSAIILFK